MNGVWNLPQGELWIYRNSGLQDGVITTNGIIGKALRFSDLMEMLSNCCPHVSHLCIYKFSTYILPSYRSFIKTFSLLSSPFHSNQSTLLFILKIFMGRLHCPRHCFRCWEYTDEHVVMVCAWNQVLIK